MDTIVILFNTPVVAETLQNIDSVHNLTLAKETVRTVIVFSGKYYHLSTNSWYCNRILKRQ